MYRKLLALAVVLAGVIFVSGSALGAAPLYEGKVIRIIVGLPAGGGYDAYARMIARHMAKHIPGNPTIVVENMTGAGSLISANYLYKVAKPDGLSIGHFNGTLFLNQLMKQPGVEFDARRFEFLGAANKEEAGFVFSKKSGITSVEKWMTAKGPVKLAGMAPGASPDNAIRIVKAALGLPIQLVSGYKGTPELRLAVEGGEADGTSFAWSSMRTTWRKSLETGDVLAVLQAVPKPFPDLPKVPLAITLAKTEEGRQLIEVGLHKTGVFSRPFVLPPGTPKERVQVLVKAFQETLTNDKEFLAEAEKSGLDIEFISAEELQKAVSGIFDMSPAFVAKLENILYK
jgi:tripartite-type tricarboxylate transporter receptor subunit TctC